MTGHSLTSVLIIVLFLSVATLLAQGSYSFRGVFLQQRGESSKQVNMRLEVVWTALAAALLLGVFAFVR